MSSPDDAHATVNLDELKEIMDNDMELIQECFTDFVQEWPELYVQIKGAIMEKNGKTLEESSHKLKGTLRYLAAENAAQAAYALESAGKDNDFNGVETKLENLKAQCQDVIQYIQTFSA